jgi:hypothetical protein
MCQKRVGNLVPFMSRLHFFVCARKASQHLPDGSGLILSEAGVDRPAQGAACQKGITPHPTIAAAVLCCLIYSDRRRQSPHARIGLFWALDPIAIPKLKRRRVSWGGRHGAPVHDREKAFANPGQMQRNCGAEPGAPQPVRCLSRRPLVG